MSDDDAAPVRLVARSDAPARPRTTVAVECVLELELADGRRVPLLTDRGWSSSAGWDGLTPSEVAETAVAVTGPDEPAPGMTAAQEEDAHWEHLAALAQAAGVMIRAGALRALPLETEASASLEALAARGRDRAEALTALLGLPEESLGTRPPEDALSAEAVVGLQRALAERVGVDPDAWSTPGVVPVPESTDAAPPSDAGRNGGLTVTLLHTTAVVAGDAALLERLRGARLADVVDPAALGARLGREVEQVEERWYLAADMNALSLNPRGGAEHLARHAGLVAALRERPVVVETAAAGDRAALRAANELGLRRVGRELRFLVR